MHVKTKISIDPFNTQCTTIATQMFKLIKIYSERSDEQELHEDTLEIEKNTVNINILHATNGA